MIWIICFVVCYWAGKALYLSGRVDDETIQEDIERNIKIAEKLERYDYLVNLINADPVIADRVEYLTMQRKTQLEIEQMIHDI